MTNYKKKKKRYLIFLEQLKSHTELAKVTIGGIYNGY